MNPSGLETDLPDIQDIIPPEPITNIWPLIGWIAIGVLAVALLVWLLVHFMILDRRRPAPQRSPQQIALQKLGEIARNAGELTPNEFSLQVSDTLKDYLSARFGDPLRFETSEEFLSRISNSPVEWLSAEKRDTVAQFVSISDEIKFGRPPDAEARKPLLLDQARAVIGYQADPQIAKR